MLSDIDSSTLRIVLRIYFVVVLAILAVIGRQCCKSAVKLRLLRHEAVSVTSMTGWLRGVDLFYNLFRLKHLPSTPSLVCVMIVGTLLSFVADVAVSGLVQKVSAPSRCLFGQGLVINTTSPGTWTTTPVNGQPYLVASYAQHTSYQNGGLRGVYHKVNGAINFYAELEDILCRWTCADLGNNITYAINTSDTDVCDDLVARGYLYPNWLSEFTSHGTGPIDHLVAWSTSADDSAHVPFEVRASIDLTSTAADGLIMQSFHCTVETHDADEILSSIHSVSTLRAWAPGFQGGVYDGSGTPAIANASTFLETYLNSMVMVQGGSNSLLRTPTGDQTQGCLIAKTEISFVVIVLVIVAGLSLLITAAHWAILLIRGIPQTRRFRGRSGIPMITTRTMQFIPDDLLGWMLQAARESSMAAPNPGTLRTIDLRSLPDKVAQLEDWDFRTADDGESCVTRLVVHGHSVPRSPTFHSPQDQQYA